MSETKNSEAYKDGLEYGTWLAKIRDEGDNYDARWDFADERRERSSQEFSDFMAGVTDGMELYRS